MILQKTLYLFATVLLSFSCLQASEQSTQNALIPRQLLFGNPEKAAPRLSPDGTKLTYLAPDANDVLNVWIRDLKHSGEDRQITSDNSRGIRSYFWQFDNQHIIYAQDKDGDENSHLYQTDILTKKTKDLTPYEGVKAMILDYDHRRPNEMVILMNKRNPNLFDVYRLDLKTGRAELDTVNSDHVTGWVTDEQGQVRVSLNYSDKGDTIIRVRDNAKSPWKELLRLSPDENGGSVEGFTNDNQSIYLIAALESDKAKLMTINLKTGLKYTLAEDPHYDISGIMFHPTTHELEAITVEREKMDWIIKDAYIATDFKLLKEEKKGTFTIVSRDLADKQWIVAFLSDIKPTQFYLFDRTNKKLTFLFTPQPELEKFELSEMKPIQFHARDGLKLHGYLTLPKNMESKNLPTVLFVHGGPWARDSWGLNPSVQWLANRGYAVLQINFRGSTGYGKAFLNAGNREWGAKMHEDLLDGKAWLLEKGFSDPTKIALYGGSYGGYAALAGLAFTPEEFCCGIDVVGPSNLITLLQSLPPYWTPQRVVFDKRVGNLKTETEFLKSRSPLFKADQITKPLLIAQGANDPRVKQAESDQIVEKMKENNKPVEYMLFEDEGHGFQRPENRLKFQAAAEQFLARYLGGRFEKAGHEEKKVK